MARTKGSKNKKPAELKLEGVLMNCRDILRGKASMATRRDMILTLVFLKFVGEKFYRQREKIRSEMSAQNLPVELFIEEPSSYQCDGVFYLPEECRWEELLSADSAKLALTIDLMVSNLDSSIENLRGALPMKLFTDSRIEGKTLKALIDEINKISEDRFHEKDLIGRVYEYFLQAFSINADKEEGEFYTPHSIVELICELIEPYDGTIYDPCCGSGGMFVQASKFVEAHGGNTKAVQVYGQESQPETYRLAKMNLAVRGISYNLGSTAASTFTNDLHKTLKASYIMANPPFNLKKWRSENELLTDVRWAGYGVPPVSNANYAWILHMLSKLNVVNGVAGFLLANGALGDTDTYEIRRKLIENDKVEAIIVLPREMFYSTDISVTLWILNQNKKGGLYHKRQLRNRTGEILFVDLRTWNQNIYEKKYVQFLPEQIQRVAEIYHTWQSVGTESTSYAVPELYRSVSLKEIKDNDFSLVPSRYIEFIDRDKDIDYERIMSDTASVVANLLKRQTENQKALKDAFKELGYEF
ncbi:N-6 DNA methylase [uncultured Sutterella sp.]|uniref:N-6 DNA methylase n=1 Tax=uncultured Sutterella sp. TaxID=286133 RepID=UPI00280BD6A1|nr:N-6 DNA methylase [uncultured Sutterella sp.]MBS5216723.1 N-6 DNA methylase [Sutterella wadsworthensis]